MSTSQRGALERQAIAYYDVWSAALLRIADAGWDALSDAERRTLMGRAETDPPIAADFIRAVGSDGWRALLSDVQHACRAAVQQDADALFRCRPSLWVDLADGCSLPPTSRVRWDVIREWRAEDAAAALSALPHEHQTLVLALASWRVADCAHRRRAWRACSPRGTE